jgi:hypothetical protein
MREMPTRGIPPIRNWKLEQDSESKSSLYRWRKKEKPSGWEYTYTRTNV